MIKNWLITAHLSSPLCGDPPMIDAILAFELALRIGDKHAKKLTRATPLSEVKLPPIPVVVDHGIRQCSDPIMPDSEATWEERIAKRFDTGKHALTLHQSQRCSLLTASGPYKMRYAPVTLRIIGKVCWFVRGDKKEINKLLKSVKSLGKCKGMGYGLVSFFDYEEKKTNQSVYSGNVLMKTIPANKIKPGTVGHKPGYGSHTFPYWHPENFTDIVIPC